MKPESISDVIGVAPPRLVRHLDLFSGIGGFALAARMVGGIETVGFCEIDPWARMVLAQNFPGVPIHHDVKTLNPKNYGRIDLITGGYPCQPFSVAGEQRRENDERHLWPNMRDAIADARPRWVLAENVAGHIAMGLDEVLSDLEALGYSAGATVLPACAVGAIHRRDRVWITAHDSRVGIPWNESQEIQGQRLLQGSENGGGIAGIAGMPALSAPRLCRASDGLPYWMDRLKGLGNAIVPQVAAEILRCMMDADSLTNDTTTPMTNDTTLADGFHATSAQATPPRVECLASTDADAINTAMEAAWGQGARVEMAKEGTARFLNIYGDGDEFRKAAFDFALGFLAGAR